MLVLHPSSTCDVCLDPYGESKVPHVITCGHTFCLWCLQLLPKQCCPLCRTPFIPGEVRRLHTDKASRSSPASLPESPCSHETTSQARTLLGRITRIVHEGAKTSEVREVIEEIHAWLLTQPLSEHGDLRAAHLLLFRYTEMQRKARDDKDALTDLQQTCQGLEERLRAEADAAETKYQELSRLRADDREAAKAAEDSFREKCEQIERDWSGKYDVCLAECRRLSDEVKDLKRTPYNPLPMPPRCVEPRYVYRIDRNPLDQESMVIVKDDSLDSADSMKIQLVSKEDMFRLSPVPPTLPIPVLSTTEFHALTDDDDRDDNGNKTIGTQFNPYTLQSIDPIPIKPNVARRPSSASLLSRHDDPMSRSLPRSIIDVHMGSYSSPAVHPPAPVAHERRPDMHSGSIDGRQEGALGLTITEPSKTSAGSQTATHDPEEQRERWRAQLRNLLDDPASSSVRPSTPEHVRPPSTDSISLRQDVSSSLPRTISAPLARNPSTRKVQHASAAAIAVERARGNGSTSPTSPPPSAAPTPSKEREMLPGSTHTPTRPPYIHRMSTESLKARSTTSSASNLTRSLWAMQEIPRAA